MKNKKNFNYSYGSFHNITKKKIIVILELISMLLLLFISKYKKYRLNDLKIKDNYTRRIPVFAFHRLVPEDVKKEKFPKNEWVGSINIFESMIKYLFNNGYKTISTLEFFKWYTNQLELDKKTVLITIDDGFYEDYYLVYPIIKKYNFKATSFILGCNIKNKTAPYNKYISNFIGMDVINKIRHEYPNFEFQSHSFALHYKNIRTMSVKDLENDISKMEKFGFTSMAYPYGNSNDILKKILKNKGYSLSFRFGPPKYATRADERWNYRMALTKQSDKLSLFIIKCLRENRIFYSTNEVGEALRNYVMWSDSYSIKN